MEQAESTQSYDWKQIVKRGLWSFSIPMVTLFYGYTNKYTSQPKILKTFVDEAIPFNRFFIIPYLIWYGYVAFFLFFLCGVDRDSYFKLLGTIVVSELIACFVFLFFPTYVPRPTVSGHDVFSSLVMTVYRNDNPYNCFPSIHVIDSIAVAIYVNESHKINKKFKITSCITAIAIVVSTMFIKQHYIADVASGALLTYSIYFLLGRVNFHGKFKIPG